MDTAFRERKRLRCCPTFNTVGVALMEACALNFKVERAWEVLEELRDKHGYVLSDTFFVFSSEVMQSTPHRSGIKCSY